MTHLDHVQSGMLGVPSVDVRLLDADEGDLAGRTDRPGSQTGTGELAGTCAGPLRVSCGGSSALLGLQSRATPGYIRKMLLERDNQAKR